MRKTESLKILKEITNEDTLSYFSVFKSTEPLKGTFAVCRGRRTTIYVYYDDKDNDYDLSVNMNSVTNKKWNRIFTIDFAKEVFDAIYFIFIQKECEKHGKEL